MDLTTLPCANLFNGKSRYTHDLLQLAAHNSDPSPPGWVAYQSPINMERLQPFLSSYPDQDLASFIRNGLVHGFRIGYHKGRECLRSRGRNHPSALANPNVVDQKIQAELLAGRLLGPLLPHEAAQVHTSPLGLVPKAHQSNKWRMIHDLSTPLQHSVNDGILPDLCSLQYSRVDDAVHIIHQLGRDTQLIKLDIKDAYRIIPTNPTDYALLGFVWRGRTYIDRALPFGLRSAPKNFNAVADFIAWVLASQGVPHQLHYLDDFLFLTKPHSVQGSNVLATALDSLRQLGIPVAPSKTEGPTTLLTFLGILIDTHRLELRLPSEKLANLNTLIQGWIGRRSCTRRELESLLGHLSHAATVIPQGRTFLRSLFSLLPHTSGPHHNLRLNLGARADIKWWATFLTDWNGKLLFQVPTVSTEVTSDASGNFGCGGFSTHHGWFQVQWPDSWSNIHITVKELIPVVIAAALWGRYWTRKRVRFNSDNMAVVYLLRSPTTKDAVAMHLLRCLAFYAAFYQFTFESRHVPGTENIAADAISRNNLSLFSSLLPQATQVCIPQSIINLLITKTPDWGSPTWTRSFRATLITESRLPQSPCTPQVGADT